MSEGFRLRVAFRKTGRLRFLSHLETSRACERAARRASLPYAVSQGFTPRMKIAFGPALPVGTAGEREYFDLTLTQFVVPGDACRSLAAATVTDLAPVACGYVAAKDRSLAAALTIAGYDVEVKGGIPREELERSLKALVDTGTLTIEHKGKHKVYDLAEALPKEPEVMSKGDRSLIRMIIRIGEHGSLRPEVFVTAALGRTADVRVTRTDLFIEHEGAWQRPL